MTHSYGPHSEDDDGSGSVDEKGDDERMMIQTMIITRIWMIMKS